MTEAEYDGREVLSPRSRRFMKAVGQAMLELIQEAKDDVCEKASPKRDLLETSTPEERHRRTLMGDSGRAAVLIAMRPGSAPVVRSPAAARSTAKVRPIDASAREAVVASVRRAHGSIDAHKARRGR